MKLILAFGDTLLPVPPLLFDDEGRTQKRYSMCNYGEYKNHNQLYNILPHYRVVHEPSFLQNIRCTILPHGPDSPPMKPFPRTTRPLDRHTIHDAIDRATAHLVRAEYQFTIPGAHQKDHFERALQQLIESRAALAEAIGVLELVFVTLYGPPN